MSEPKYSRATPERSKSRFVAIGGERAAGMLATRADFQCNEYKPAK